MDDLVEGLIALMYGNYSLPVNLGNPDEYTVNVSTWLWVQYHFVLQGTLLMDRSHTIRVT